LGSNAVKFLKKHQQALSRIPVAYFFTAMSLTRTGDTHLNGVPIQAALVQKPCAVFLVCMTLTISNGKYRDQVADWLEPVRAVVKPVSEGLFAGAFDISTVPSFWDRLKFRLSVMSSVWSEGDHRDWNAIRAWANSLRPLLLR
jgi:menaquinone-dependent protoporphyrinogen IX oxidase